MATARPRAVFVVFETSAEGDHRPIEPANAHVEREMKVWTDPETDRRERGTGRHILLTANAAYAQPIVWRKSERRLPTDNGD